MANATLHVDLEAIAHNWRALKGRVAAGVEVAAVVKANAYGLGAAQVAPALYSAGARSFFVAQAVEAAALRPHLADDATIWVITGYMPGDKAAYAASGAQPMLNSPSQLAAFRADFPNRAYGLDIDSGMSRLGFEPQALAALAFASPPVRPALLSSHLACADTPAHPMNAAQLGAFSMLTAALPMVKKSLANSAGIFLGAPYHFNLCRPGIAVYTGDFEGGRLPLRAEFPIIQTRQLMPGQSVGYGATWTATRPSRIATVAGGYADGIFRGLRGLRLFCGQTPCPVVGRISMDLIGVDITELPDTPESLTLIGPEQSPGEIAALAGTISYEVLTALGARYNRVYRGAKG
ncbi:MAG: alanine racemase [Paracoccaceae bacterium]